MVSLHWSSRSKMPVFERQAKIEQKGENRKEREKTIGNSQKNLQNFGTLHYFQLHLLDL